MTMGRDSTTKFALLVATWVGVACGAPKPVWPHQVGPAVNPLGSSYLLIPLPSDDASALGRIVPIRPTPGQALAEIARPNPCAKYLSRPETVTLAAHFEDAVEASRGAETDLMLNGFGFGGEATKASHFVYSLDTSQQLSRRDTLEYDQCCQSTDCGYGYVSALVYGRGEYAVASETQLMAKASIGVVSIGGHNNLNLINKRYVQGWLAALVTVTRRLAPAPAVRAMPAHAMPPHSMPAHAMHARTMHALEPGPEVTLSSLSLELRDAYRHNRILVLGAGPDFVFVDGSGDRITENEFVRRYGRLTGSEELDDYKHHRNPGLQIGSAAMLGIGTTMFLYGIRASRDCNADDYWSDGKPREGGCRGTSEMPSGRIFHVELGVPLITFGSMLAIAGGVMTIASSTILYDGKPKDHTMTDADARIHATKYNHALVHKLRSATHGVARERPAVEVQPFVWGSAAGVSLQGRF